MRLGHVLGNIGSIVRGKGKKDKYAGLIHSILSDPRSTVNTASQLQEIGINEKGSVFMTRVRGAKDPTLEEIHYGQFTGEELSFSEEVIHKLPQTSNHIIGGTLAYLLRLHPGKPVKFLKKIGSGKKPIEFNQIMAAHVVKGIGCDPNDLIITDNGITISIELKNPVTQ